MTSTFNARDQMTSTIVRQGTSGAGQETLMTYDGHGRAATVHAPIQSSGSVTSITYNTDDTIATKTDARGVVGAYTYNNRRMPLSVSYPNTAPTGVPETATVSFTYDAVGNRTSMTDGIGSVSYQYDPLSRLTSESRTFTGVGTFALSYGYNLAGQLTSISDPWNAQVGYTRDRTGRLTNVTGEGYAGGADYVSGFQYRASGALKEITYSNGVQASLTYTNRMQPSNYKLTSPYTLMPTPLDIDYSYTADGLLRNSTDKRDATLDRAYRYDHTGRLIEAFTASEARSWVQTGGIGTVVDGPYRQSYTHDVWSNMTSKWGRSYTSPHTRWQTVSHPYNETSGRNTDWTYDADGRVTAPGDFHSYDEAGRLYEVMGDFLLGQFTYDGDGRRAKRVNDVQASTPPQTYYLSSSVLGQTIAEIEPYDDSRRNGYVYADGELIANQTVGAVFWQHRDASGRSCRTSYSTGEATGRDELDPQDVTVERNGEFPPKYLGGSGGINAPGGGEARVASLMDLSMCDWGGMRVPCAMRGSLDEHLSSLSEQMQNHWNGWTTLTIDEPAVPEATASVGQDGKPKKKKRKKKTIPVPISTLGRNQQKSQKPISEQRYSECAKLFGDSPVIPYAQATAIVGTSALEGTDPTLIAVTWAAEAIPPFNFHPVSNPRDDGGADVGPMQTATTVYNKAPFTDGLTNPFGTTRSKTEHFNGNSHENLLLGARALNDAYGQTRRGEDRRAVAAGIYRAGSRTGTGYSDRVAQFNQWKGNDKKGYDVFFRCLRK